MGIMFDGRGERGMMASEWFGGKMTRGLRIRSVQFDGAVSCCMQTGGMYGLTREKMDGSTTSESLSSSKFRETKSKSMTACELRKPDLGRRIYEPVSSSKFRETKSKPITCGEVRDLEFGRRTTCVQAGGTSPSGEVKAETRFDGEIETANLGRRIISLQGW